MLKGGDGQAGSILLPSPFVLKADAIGRQPPDKPPAQRRAREVL